MRLADLADLIEDKLHASHSTVVAQALLLFKQTEKQKQEEAAFASANRGFHVFDTDTLETTFVESPWCSYAIMLPKYIALKRLKARCDSDRFYYHLAAEANYEKNNLDQQLKLTHEHLYKNPCYKCDVCKSRKKPWPEHCNVRFPKSLLT